MSAFVMSEEGYARLLGGVRMVMDDARAIVLAETGECGPEDDGEWLQWLGARLWACNVRSVNYRYDEDMPEDRGGVAFAVDAEPSLVQGVKSLACWDYQSCEPDGWEDDPWARAMRGVQEKMVRRWAVETLGRDLGVAADEMRLRRTDEWERALWG